MYKYQCSKTECGTTWTLHEGRLNGFVLTCPICEKGRGLFISQAKNIEEKINNDSVEEITITLNLSAAKSKEELLEKIDQFCEKYSLEMVDKNIDSTKKEIVCRIKYRLIRKFA